MAKEPETVALTFTVDGEDYQFLSDDELTFGEVAELERYCGKSLGEITADGLSVQSMMYQLYLAMRKRNAAVTLQQVAELPMTTFNTALEHLQEAQASKAKRPKSSNQKTPATSGDQS